MPATKFRPESSHEATVMRYDCGLVEKEKAHGEQYKCRKLSVTTK